MKGECINCHKTFESILKCKKCKLPDVFYCSKECQIEDRPNHKVDCTLGSIIDINDNRLKLRYNPDEGCLIKNYDAALKFAKKYMTNLTILQIYIEPTGIWTEEEMSEKSFEQIRELEPVITFSYETLYDFFKSVPLEDVMISGDVFLEKQTCHFTRDGRVFKPLRSSSTLKSFSISMLAIKKVSYLPFLSTLKGFQISFVKISKWNGPDGWSQEDVTELVSKVSELKELVKLELRSVPLHDKHLNSLLSNMKKLRCFGLVGRKNPISNTSRVQPLITNQGCQIIQRLQPNLQLLSLSYNRDVTKTGALKIVEGCRHLRDLRVIGCSISEKDLREVVSSSSTLLSFKFGSVTQSAPKSKYLLKALKATGGRTLIGFGYDDGHYNPSSGISAAERERTENSKRLVDEAYNRINGKYSCYNLYSHLWNVDVSV